ncbi:MAG: hypothetical protein NC350_05235 [Corallococcus sp.]|nr:hypothetical protein [Corallococcus sp.]
MLKKAFEKIKNFIDSKYGKSIIFTSAMALSLLFTVIFYSVKLTPLNIDEDGNLLTLWSAIKIQNETYNIRGLNIFFLIAFFAQLALLAAGALLSFFKQNQTVYFVGSCFGFAMDVVTLIIHIVFAMLQPAAVVFIVLDMLLCAVVFFFLLLNRRRNLQHLEQSEVEVKNEPISENILPRTKAVSERTLFVCRIIMLVCQCLATVAMFSTLFVPVYKTTNSGGGADAEEYAIYSLIQTLSNPSMPIYFHLAFLAVFIGCIVGLLGFISSISYFKSKLFAQKSKSYIYGITYFTLAFFVVTYVISFIIQVSDTADDTGSIVGYLPFVFSLISLLVHSVAMGKSGEVYRAEKSSNPLKLKAEPLIYVSLMTLGLYSTLLLNVVKVQFVVSSITVQNIKLSGFDLLTKYGELAGGFQIVAFLLFAMLLTSTVMLLMSLFSLIAKNKDYYKIVKTCAFTNIAFALLIGLFGVYFKIAQQINEENIKSLLDMYGVANPIYFDYTLSGQTIAVLIECGLVFTIMLFRKQFNLAVEQTEMEVTLKNTPEMSLPAAADALQSVATEENSISTTEANFDACPAFTELDGKIQQFDDELDAKRRQLFENFTLPNLVRFVVDYARESRLHLSYTLEDIATFVAGLGASRLTILQGMSGTGKTSLPKIFTEALMGVCEIVEVESSWRDKYELLGYYNEFSKCFTPKKFTQCLYKARLNSSVLTLIVLDEMNLSRIEYYFSDFLSLMENEPDKREIKLLNVKLCRNEAGVKIPYRGLTEGHTIKIPQNVWFVGTANRDESTFAISDKVYDRAQTMNFDKRAPKVHSFSQPLAQRYVSYEMLVNLFEQAKDDFAFDAESDIFVQKTEQLLAPYNISFGNRILKQMEDFVKIYCACFGDRDAVVKEAVEKILLSKVVSKLENKVVENKEILADEFERLGLNACSAFVRKLNED